MQRLMRAREVFIVLIDIILVKTVSQDLIPCGRERATQRRRPGATQLEEKVGLGISAALVLHINQITRKIRNLGATV